MEEDKVKKFRIGCLKMIMSVTLSTLGVAFVYNNAFNMCTYHLGLSVGFIFGLSFSIFFSGAYNFYKVFYPN